MAIEARVVRRSAGERLAIVECYAAMFMLGFMISLLGPSLPGLAERTGVTLPQAGFLFTLFSGGSILGTLFVAPLNDRPIRRWTFLFGTLLMAASLYLLSVSRTFLHAGAAMALAGLAMSTGGTVPNALFLDQYRERAGRALNGLHMFAGIGSFIGPLVTAVVYRGGGDYAVSYRLAAGMMFAVAVVWLFARPPLPMRRVEAPARSGGRWLWPLFFVLILALLYTGTEQVLAGWLFTYGRDALSLLAPTASLATSLFWGAVLVGRLTAVAALRRLTNVRLVQVCLIMALGGIALILGGRNWPILFWIGVALVGAGFGPIFPTGLVLSSELAPQRSGAVATWFVAAGSLGSMILPAVAGGLIPLIGIAGSIALSVLPVSLMLLTMHFISARAR